MLRWKRTRKELVKTSFRGDDVTVDAAATADADVAAYVTNIPDVYKSPKRQSQVNCIARSRTLVAHTVALKDSQKCLLVNFVV